MQITEDTPPDMLAGAMDLTLHLPSGKIVKMSVERNTPMMDLLVQITTVHHLQLSNHTLQVLGMAPTKEHSDKVLPFKPNTPIGTLDTQHIRVLPKRKIAPVPKCVAPGHQPFESTFRLKVHLPRNQLYVTRVGQNVLLDEIMRKVCEEKNLDPAKYDFKHPENLDEILDPKLTLSDYQITEIYVVHKNSINLNRAFSTADIMALRKEEERKHINNKTGGVFNLIFGHKRGKPSTVSGSISSDNRSISPSHSEDARSVTPPVVQHPPIVAPPKNDPPPDRPKPPQRKRRPAPKPPQIQVTEPVKEEEVKPVPVLPVEEPLNPASRKPSENGVTICHSRNSSDSSGYHEASILSEHCANASLPRARPKSAFVGDSTSHQGTSNLNSMAGHSRSTTSLVGGRRKKAAPPPPPAVPSPSVTPPSSVVAQPSQPSPVVVASQPDSTIQPEPISPLDSNSAYPPLTQPVEELIPEIIPCSDIEELGTPPPPPVLEEPTDKEEKSVVDAIVPSEETYEPVEEQSSSHEHPLSEDKSLIEETYEPPPPPIIDQELEFNQITPRAPKQFSQTPQPDLLTLNWEYKLPPPPRPFRDASPTNLTTNRSDTVSEFRDSVVTSPELFEKLRADDNQSDITLKSEVTSVASEEPLNTLSLENLEKRRSLVYNREITTSLKMTDKEQNFRPSPPKPVRNVHSTHTLPNFKITTYEVPKHKNITVFEDDSIRSNTHSLPSGLTKNKLGYSMDNVNQQEKEYNFYKPEVKTNGVSRSGSFSTDNRFSTKPVSRSRSTLTLNKPQFGKRDDNGNISRSNSLFDVSGLQSLEVMKLIQNKLNTPTSSMENINSATKPTSIPPTPKTDTDDEKTSVTSSKSTSPTPVRKYYRGQPSVNVFTWSERPKIPVAVKEDEDYKLGNHATISEEESNISNNNNNNTEITQNSGGNVVIRIGGSTNKPLSNRFVGPVAYRKPFSDLNSRPHSIALPSDFDASRVPIVRSVELKKPFINGNDHLSPTNDSNKRILRVNSFKPFENHVVPVVRGFNTNKSPDIISKRLSWSPANSYSSTLPKQLEKDYSTNKHVPFSQFTLRRTESNRRLTENVPYKSLPTDLETPPAPPPPPQMPKVTLRKAQVEPKSSKAHNSLDARDMLLESIRSFGGKKGLRSTKA
ncbi:uncharacterized protein LOC126734957 isoform X3 [Anthonomus grandis grandis]|uniref:uncharacterized protein LOC126734957 isoform X3 n=1 Tax=Anthonomus grandis grandis TaxID=2921223 RepID=UPI0021654E57|nr:uncharacterized protein LOC126734957 isoform X3 [Anthonomus grandis grandis]